MNNISIIIPIHEYSEENVTLLKNAISTVPNGYGIVISTPSSIVADFAEGFGDNIRIVSNTDSTKFADLVNTAVDMIDTDWFSILEFDDEYTNIWFPNVETYMKETPDVSVFMPLEDMMEYDTKKYIGFGNEAAWASAFSNEIGYIDNECLQNYFDFYLTGSIFNTNDWKEVGGLKPSIKITFWYEFLLRLTNKNKKVFVIPKVGYNHYFNRENSLTNIYRNNINKAETEWWFDLAKKDYFFKEEKEASYYVFDETKMKSDEDDE